MNGKIWPERYARLNKDWALRAWSDLPHALVNIKTGEVRSVDQKTWYVLESCDGRTNLNGLAFLPEHSAVLSRLIQEKICAECEKGEDNCAYQKFRCAINPFIHGVHWSVTGRCNLKCRHCYMESPSGKYGELSTKEIDRIIDQFVRANVVKVSLTGGEPFLRKDICHIIELLGEKKISIPTIYSNGLLITDIHLEAIKVAGFIPTFQVSFDGLGWHDTMRGVAGAEWQTIQAIQLVKTAGFPVVIATCVDQLNVESLVATYELLKAWGIHSWRISKPDTAGNWRNTNTDISLANLQKACLIVMKRWLEDGRPFPIQFAGFTPVWNKEPVRFLPEDYDCTFCREEPSLLSDGTLLPCPGYVDSLLHQQMPNLLKDDLSQVWTSSIVRDIVEIKKQDLLARNPECGVCDDYQVCGMGCRASALNKTHNLMAKDPVYCEMAKMGYKKPFEELIETHSL